MKRISILAFLVLLASSCVREAQVLTPLPSPDPTVPIVLSFTEPVTLRAGTKAGTEMGVTPAIESIHVAVFGSSGYLKDYASAVPCDAQGHTEGASFASTNVQVYYFLVRLQVNLEESLRTVHIIANGPSSLPFNAGENEIMKEMSVKDGTGAYWQRIVLPKGIHATEEDGAYRVDAEVAEAFRGITLVRNFASVTLTESAPNFKLLSYTLCNMPSSGSVAMYSDNHGDWIYSTNKDKHADCPGEGCTSPYHGMLWSAYDELAPNLQYDPDSGDALQTYDSNFPEGFIVYADGSGTKSYDGYPLNPELDTYIPSTVAEYEAAGVAVSEGSPVYVYERAVTNENPPYILLKGIWIDREDLTDEQAETALEQAIGNGTATTYFYRLDITRDSDYVPIYRNYQYTINITGVETKGYDTPEEASQHSSGDNFSVSLDTETLADVSNGKIHLFVQKPFIDMTYTADPQTFWFRLLQIDYQSAINDASHVSIKEKSGGNALKNFSVANADSDADEDGSAKERVVTFTLNDDPFGETESMRSSTLKIVGSLTVSGKTYKLVREVTIRVYNPKPVELSLDPGIVAAQEGEETTLGVPLPLDLQRSMFPLEILISDSDNALNPVNANPSESMPVKTEGSLYGFVYTLNWTKYDRLRNDAVRAGLESALLNCDLKTIKTSELYETTNVYETTITASCRYFTGNTVLHADKDNLITPSKQTVDEAADIPFRTASVKVKSESAWTLSLTYADGSAVVGATIVPSTGASTTGTNVEITLPEGGGSNIPYTLTMTNASVTRTASILQQGSSIDLELRDAAYDDPTDHETLKNVPHGSGSGVIVHSSIVKVTSGVSYYLEACDPDGNWTTGPACSPTDPEVLWLPVNNTISERTLTIRARDTHEPFNLVSNEIELTQDAGIASLTVNTPNLMLFESEASVTVDISFPTVLMVLDSNGDEIPGILVRDANNQEVGTTGGSDPVLLTPTTTGVNDHTVANYTLVLPPNVSGADQIMTLKLFNMEGLELADGTTDRITHAGTPVMTLSAVPGGNLSIRGNENTCDILIVSDEDWSISSSVSGVSFSPSSGTPTTGTMITVTLPSGNNYKYDNPADPTFDPKDYYPITAVSSESGSTLDASVTIIKRGATINTDSAPFNTRKQYNGGLYYSNRYSATVKHITGTFAPTNKVTLASSGTTFIDQGIVDYVTLDYTGCTLTLTRNNTVNVQEVKAVTRIAMSFDSSNYTPDVVTVNSSSDGVYGETWTGEATGTETVISMTNNHTYYVFPLGNVNYDIRIVDFTVDYEYYTWE